MLDSLEERLKSYNDNFKGLLSIIPANRYYEKDTSDQWRRKKQTKEEARAARFAKLDPANALSALDVMEERAGLKRKRRGSEARGESSDEDSGAIEKPREGMKSSRKDLGVLKKQKKQKAEDGKSREVGNGKEKTDEEIRGEKAERRKQKRTQKKERKAEQKLKKEERKARKAKGQDQDLAGDDELGAEGVFEESDDEAEHVDLDPATIEALSEAPPAEDSSRSNADQGHDSSSSRTASPKPASPLLSTSSTGPQSGTSSISSVADPSTIKESLQKPSTPSSSAAAMPPPPKPTAEELKARLQKRIEALRTARKADNDDGSPARSRQDLIEQRRKREEQRKAAKKVLRQQAREEERARLAEEMARGSPLLSPAGGGATPTSFSAMGLIRGQSPLGDGGFDNNFSFGRVAFANGQQMTADLGSVLDLPGSKLDGGDGSASTVKKKKGPQDVRTALEAAQNKAARLSGLDAGKRADIGEKESWLKARKAAQGERVRDDVSLLKRALKKKEKAKKKSEKEWGERTDGVKKSQEARQKKREENLRKRREEKGSKSGKGGKGGKKSSGAGGKKKARPGFEGSFRAGGGKKK